MPNFPILKVPVKPTTFQPNTLYIVDNITSGQAELYFSSSDGTTAVWSDIIGVSSASPTADAPAVGDGHTHTNKSVIDKLTESSDGYLRFNGGPAINVFLVSQDW